MPCSCAASRQATNSRSEEHTSELQHSSISYAVFCLKKKNKILYLQNIPPEKLIIHRNLLFAYLPVTHLALSLRHRTLPQLPPYVSHLIHHPILTNYYP